MNPLESKIRRLIELGGPMSVAEYWTHCLFDTANGYYTTRMPIGAAGDFTTAPEISQIFGELLAAWWLATVRQNGIEPALVEIGPGRGTLMADMLRTLGKLDPSLKHSLSVHMVEVSPRLTALQQEKLAGAGFQVTWHETIATLPKIQAGIIANELFDAIPMRQFIKSGNDWNEVTINIDADGKLYFAASPASLDSKILPVGHETQHGGSIFEYSPAREAMMQDLGHHIHQHGGFGLFIDYGHATPGFGDTLQAMKDHAYANVLENPGEADITSHVDFQSLATAAAAVGLYTAEIITQGELLTRVGITERAESLVKAHPQLRDSIETAIDRLVSPRQMGNLFKVLGIAHPSVTLTALQMAG
jgi:SAM-dependent MidA family methyltransferase